MCRPANESLDIFDFVGDERQPVQLCQFENKFGTRGIRLLSKFGRFNFCIKNFSLHHRDVIQIEIQFGYVKIFEGFQ